MLHLCRAIVVASPGYFKNCTMLERKIYLNSVNSTNDYLASALKRGSFAEEGVVVAEYQEYGKGQGGHRWHSNRGENLLMSVLLFPAFLSASEQFQLTRVASLAISDLLSSMNLETRIKWPNDLIVNQRKIAGILIENGITGQKLSHVIIGIGLNLNQVDFPDFPLPATSLLLETGIRTVPAEVAEQLAEALESRYRQLERGGELILEGDYLGKMYLLDCRAVFLSDGIQFEGIIRGVNDDGELLVETMGKTRSFSFHQIQYMLPGAG
jgi:BirA family biotin operon repressor/biotin-[acetyl-CoA-carboxylase] ligase